ncbi:MAG: hypothetical protein MOIL_01523 [Candidatus Methanolliviera sp. GoM_oil]|nr:MAG: hypothetical protein MOIL_01523 [Candidatus Methanolliviera sp. GoM_oil]
MDKKTGSVLQICLVLIILVVAVASAYHYLSARPVQEEIVPEKEEVLQEVIPLEERQLPKDYYEVAYKEVKYHPEKHDINSLYTVLINTDKLPGYKEDYFDCSEMSAYLEWYLEGMGFHSYIAHSDDLDHMWVMVELDDGDMVAIEPALLAKGKNYSSPGIIERTDGKYRAFSYKVEMYKRYIDKIGNDTSRWQTASINDIEKDPSQTYDYRWVYGESRSYPVPSYWEFAKNKKITINGTNGDGDAEENNEEKITEDRYYDLYNKFDNELFDTPADAIEKGLSISEFDWWHVLPWGSKEPFISW